MWKDSADVEKHVQFLESIYGAGSASGPAARAPEPALRIVSKFDRERGAAEKELADEKKETAPTTEDKK